MFICLNKGWVFNLLNFKRKKESLLCWSSLNRAVVNHKTDSFLWLRLQWLCVTVPTELQGWMAESQDHCEGITLLLLPTLAKCHNPRAYATSWLQHCGATVLQATSKSVWILCKREQPCWIRLEGPGLPFTRPVNQILPRGPQHDESSSPACFCCPLVTGT